MSLKVFCSGAEHYINQINRIRQGFVENSCELVEDISKGDIIYANDPGQYDFILNNRNRLKSGAKIIFNVLDYPVHLIDRQKYDLSRWANIEHNYVRNFDIDGLTDKLKQADIVTTICDEVTYQTKYFSGIDAYTIYNPIKPVSWLNLKNNEKVKNSRGENYKYIFIGRIGDPAKRAHLMIETLKLLGEDQNKLAVVGTENIGFGEYFGVLNDISMNTLLNSVEYLFLPSIFKSVSLPALEAVVCHVKPIVCSDDKCSQEFFGDLGMEPNPIKIAEHIKNQKWNNDLQNWVNSKSDEYRQKFSPKQIAKNILEVYERFR